MHRQARGVNRDVESFLEFCAADRELVCGLSSYCDEVVQYFEHASLEGEQELGWTAMHGEFLARSEAGLLRWLETREGVDAATVCEQIAALFDAPAASSAGLPLSFRLADYPSFLAEILNRRDLPQRIAAADAARRVGNPGSLSGVWRAQTDVAAKDLDRFLTALGTASWLRGAAQRHLRSLRRAVLHHADDELSVALDWGWFGQTHEVLQLDGTGVPRAWADTNVHSSGGGYACAGVHVQRLEEAAPLHEAALEEEWRLDGEHLVWVRRIRHEDGDVVELPVRFAAETVQPRARAQTPADARADEEYKPTAPVSPVAERKPAERKPAERKPKAPARAARAASPAKAQPHAPPPRPRATPAPAGIPPLRPAPIPISG